MIYLMNVFNIFCIVDFIQVLEVSDEKWLLFFLTGKGLQRQDPVRKDGGCQGGWGTCTVVYM